MHGVSRSELALQPKSLEQRARPRHASLTVNTPLLESLAGDEEAEAVWRAACSAGKRNLSQEVHGWRIKWVPRHASQGTKDGDIYAFPPEHRGGKGLRSLSAILDVLLLRHEASQGGGIWQPPQVRQLFQVWCEAEQGEVDNCRATPSDRRDAVNRECSAATPD